MTSLDVRARPLGSRRLHPGPTARVPRRAAPHPARLLAGHARRARLLGGAHPRRPHRRRPRAGALLGERGWRRAREPRRGEPRADAGDAAGDGPAAARRLPAAAGAELQGARHRRPRGPDPHHLPGDHGHRTRSGRRRLRARRRHAAPEPGGRRAHGPPAGGLGPDPALGGEEHERPGSRHRRRRRPSTTAPASPPPWRWRCTRCSSRRNGAPRHRATT